VGVGEFSGGMQTTFNVQRGTFNIEVLTLPPASRL
jgi:hypothetical protein